MNLLAQIAPHDWDYQLEREGEHAQVVAEGRCPDCNDSGEIQWNPHPRSHRLSMDPQEVVSAPCRCVLLRDRAVA